MPIYTRTGDKGETSLYGAKRIKKSDALLDVYGTIDELNSWVGVVTSQLTDVFLINQLRDIQADLHLICSVFAGWSGDLSELKVCAEDMEVWIDQMDKQLPELRHFILPGGVAPASFAHVGRTVCRRAERRLVTFLETKPEGFHISDEGQKEILKYINRLSDLFFQLARFINKDAGGSDITWQGIKK